MKKLFLLAALIAIFPLTAGNKHTKTATDEIGQLGDSDGDGDDSTSTIAASTPAPMQQQTTATTTTATTTQTKSKPFNGEKWNDVRIASNGNAVHAIYGKSIKKWDINGTRLIAEYPLQELVGYETISDTAYYQYNSRNIYRTSFNDGTTTKIESHKPISKLYCSAAGIILQASDQLTLIDEDGMVKASMQTTNLTESRLWFLDSGMCYVTSGNKDAKDISSIDWDKKTVQFILSVGHRNFNKILRKKYRDNIIATYPDSAVYGTTICLIDDKKKEVNDLCTVSHQVTDWDINNNLLAIADVTQNQLKIFNVSSSGSPIYHGNIQGMSGICDMRFSPENEDLIYFVGTRPKPRTITIDMREMSHE